MKKITPIAGTRRRYDEIWPNWWRQPYERITSIIRLANDRRAILRQRYDQIVERMKEFQIREHEFADVIGRCEDGRWNFLKM